VSSKSIGSLNVKMTADASAMFATFNSVSARASQLSNQMNGQGAGSGSGGMLGGLGFGAGAGAGFAGVVAVVDVLKKGVQYAERFAEEGYKAQVEYNKAAIAISAMTDGNQSATRTILDQSRDLAANSPFDPTVITNYAKRLLGAGVAADQVMPTIKALSDVAAGVGGDFDLIARAYTQTMAKGKLAAEELNGQFADQGLGAAFFAKQLKLPTDQFLEMVKAGEIGSEKLTEAFRNVTQAGGQFFNMSKKMADVDPMSKISKTFGETKRLAYKGMSDLLDLPGLAKGVDQLLQSVNRGLGGKKAADSIGALTPVKPIKIAEVPQEVKDFMEEFKKLKPLKMGGYEQAGLGEFSRFANRIVLAQDALRGDPKKGNEVGFDQLAHVLGQEFLKLEKQFNPADNGARLIEAGTQAAEELVTRFEDGAKADMDVQRRVENLLDRLREIEEGNARTNRAIFDVLNRQNPKYLGIGP
jgi:tape measure domain-containing protein